MSNHLPPHDTLEAPPLSESGQRRRDLILDDLHSQLRRRKSRRRVINTTAAAALFAAVGIPTFLMLRSGDAPRTDSTLANVDRPPTDTAPILTHRTHQSHTSHPSPRLATNSTTPSAIAPSADNSTGVIIRIVSSNSLAPLNCSEPPRTPASTPAVRVCMLSDDQLLQELANAGQDCGLIRMGNRAELTCDVLGKH